MLMLHTPKPKYGVLLFDIKDSFDNVNHDRLNHLMESPGSPRQLPGRLISPSLFQWRNKRLSQDHHGYTSRSTHFTDPISHLHLATSTR